MISDTKVYWTKDRIIEVSTKCSNRTEFHLKYKGAYESARKNGCLDEVCIHMISKRRPNGYWTYEICKSAAEKCKSRRDFQNKYGSTYHFSLKNSWMDSICSHMPSVIELRTIWTKSKIVQEAKKYNSRLEFCDGSKSAYDAALRTCCIDEACIHMKSNSKWTKKENVINEAKKYVYLNEFRTLSKGAYGSAHKNGWMKSIKPLFKPVGDKLNRCVYVYKFSDNHVYVGLTYNLAKRSIDRFRKKGDAVRKHIIETNLVPELIQLTKYIPASQAAVKEEYFLNKFKKEGFIPLNVAKTGSVGGSLIMWNYENCLKKAKLYKTRSEFRRDYPGAYASVCKNKWLDEVYSHMTSNYVRKMKSFDEIK